MDEAGLAWLVIAGTIGVAVLGTIWRKWFRSCASKADLEEALAELRSERRVELERLARIEISQRQILDALADLAWRASADGP